MIAPGLWTPGSPQHLHPAAPGNLSRASGQQGLESAARHLPQTIWAQVLLVLIWIGGLEVGCRPAVSKTRNAQSTSPSCEIKGTLITRDLHSIRQQGIFVGCCTFTCEALKVLHVTKFPSCFPGVVIKNASRAYSREVRNVQCSLPFLLGPHGGQWGCDLEIPRIGAPPSKRTGSPPFPPARNPRLFLTPVTDSCFALLAIKQFVCRRKKRAIHPRLVMATRFSQVLQWRGWNKGTLFLCLFW